MAAQNKEKPGDFFEHGRKSLRLGSRWRLRSFLKNELQKRTYKAINTALNKRTH